MNETYKIDEEHININNIYLLSDLHFGVRVNSFEWLDNHTSYFKNFFIPLIENTKQSNDAIFILGDWFDNRQQLDILVMNRSISLVKQMANILPVYFIVGNHDIYKKKDTDVNSLSIFKDIPNVKVFENPTVLKSNTFKVLLLPWVGDKNKEEEYIKHTDLDYVFAHTDIEGFLLDNGREIKNSALNYRKFKKIKRMFSGHIHKRQERGNFIYLGSPYHTKRSDINNEKGVYIFNPSNNSINFYKNDYSPIFQRINLSNLLDMNLEEVKNILNNNYTDIIIPDKYVREFNLAKFIEYLNDCNFKKLEAINEISNNLAGLDDVLSAIEIKDIFALLELGIDEMGYPDETVSLLKNLNKTYYEKASKEDVI